MSEDALERLSRHPDWCWKPGMVYLWGHALLSLPGDWPTGERPPKGFVLAENPSNVGWLIEKLEDLVGDKWQLSSDEHGMWFASPGHSMTCPRPDGYGMCEALATAILLELENDEQ